MKAVSTMVHRESVKIVLGLKYTKGLRTIYAGNHTLKRKCESLICQIKLPIPCCYNPMFIPTPLLLYLKSELLKTFSFFFFFLMCIKGT